MTSRWIVGIPGWWCAIGLNWETGSGYVFRWAWRRRVNPPMGEYSFHFLISIRFGRTLEGVQDFGGPMWWPRLIKRWPSKAYAVPSSRWTGHQYEIAGIDWPRLQFNFTKIPEGDAQCESMTANGEIQPAKIGPAVIQALPAALGG